MRMIACLLPPMLPCNRSTVAFDIQNGSLMRERAGNLRLLFHYTNMRPILTCERKG